MRVHGRYRHRNSNAECRGGGVRDVMQETRGAADLLRPLRIVRY